MESKEDFDATESTEPRQRDILTIGLKLKTASPLVNTVLMTVANGRVNSGYVPYDKAFGANTFQVLGSRLKPGCAENAIVDGLVDMIHASGSEKDSQ